MKINMILIYCKTVDNPKNVADCVCKYNFSEENSETKSRVINDESEDGCWIIQNCNPQNETSAMIYRIGPEIVCIEIDDNCASNVIEPLMKKYGFDNVKWLSTKECEV
jgi:hypothetical protein